MSCCRAGRSSDCRTAAVTSPCCRDKGCCSTISTGDPTSRKNWRDLVSTTSEATIPMPPPTAAPITVLFPLSAGTVRLDDRHPGGGPPQPGGSVLVIVVPCELATEWPINAPSPAPAAG